MNPARPGRRSSPPVRGRSRTDNAIVAAAEKLTDRLNKSGSGGGQIGEPWQRDMWELYDKVPELRTASRITGRTMGQCRLVLARVNEKGEPAPLDYGTPEEPGPDADHPGRALLAAFAGGQWGQRDVLDAIGVALTGPGECELIGTLDQTDRDTSDDFTRMQVYSTEQVITKGGGKIAVRLDESSMADRFIEGEGPEDTDDSKVTAIRIWRPHPRFSWKADSAARGSLGVLREIKGYDDHIKASLLSRLAGAGLLGIPEGMTLPASMADEEPGEDGGQVDPFMIYMMEIMALAIGDRESAAALVPILLRGEAEDIAAIRHITMDTPFDQRVSENRNDAVGRFGVAVDMPGELLTGYGALQHWTGALITEDFKGGYLAELMGLLCGSLTQGWFYPALVQMGHDDLPADVIVWYDDSSVRTRENVGPEAQAAYDRGEIKGDTYRRALGYDAEDMPEGEEGILQVLRTIALKAPATAPIYLAKLGFKLTPEESESVRALTEAIAAPQSQPPEASGEGQASIPTEPGSQAEPTPGTQPGLVPVAAATQRALRGFQNGVGAGARR